MKIYCIGIGGIGMSAIAQILFAKDEEISGSDSSGSEITKKLIEKGIHIDIGHDEKHIDESYDLVIYSEAVPETNPEREKASELNIHQVNYAEALGMIGKKKKTIAVSGTHGKTTVTGMLASILLQSSLDPTIVIGSKMDLLNHSNYRVGSGEWFLAEACEYRHNFLHLTPEILIINNLEPEHLDYFINAENYYKSFQQLAEKVPSSGKVIMYEEDKEKLKRGKIRAEIIFLPNNSERKFQLNVPGLHNQHNALTAYTVGKALGLSDEMIQKGFESFNGTWRRFEYKGEIKGAKLYDDYGHHPTEIAATLQGAREFFPEKELVIIFQPHQYSRTREFFEEFCLAFNAADEVWITDIYQARDSEEDIKAVSAEKLVEGIKEAKKKKYIPFDSLAREIEKQAQEQRLFLVMGAGSIHNIFSELDASLVK